MKKLCIVAAVWKRPHIFELFADGIDILKDHFKGRLDISVSIVGSEGVKSKSMVESRGFSYCECPNNPLGFKMNRASLGSIQYDPDFVMWLGSDDVVTPELMEHYIVAMDEGIDYTFLMDYYFFDTITKQAFYWGGYNHERVGGNSCGAGRMISKRVLGLTKYKLWYNDRMHRILDTSMDVLLNKIPMTRKELWLKELDCFSVDIKCSKNMTQFYMWDNTHKVDGKEMLFNNLPTYFADKIYNT